MPIDIDPQCLLISLSKDDQCAECFNNDVAVVECERVSPSLLGQRLFTPSLPPPDTVKCIDSSLGTSQANIIVPPGLYISELRFCSDGCIDKVLFPADNPRSFHLESTIEMYIYKRHTSRDIIQSSPPQVELKNSPSELFVQQTVRNITLTYNLQSNSFEARIGHLHVCVKQGEQLGLEIKEDVQLFGTNRALQGEGVFVNLSSWCADSALEAVVVDYKDVVNMSPLFSIEFIKSSK